MGPQHTQLSRAHPPACQPPLALRLRLGCGCGGRGGWERFVVN